MIVLPDRLAVVLDIETTEAPLAAARGTFPQPIEIGAVLIDCEFEVVSEFEMLIQPEPFDEFTDFSESFTGIKSDELRAAPVWKDAWQEFAKFTNFNGHRLISWGAPFDYAVLSLAYGRIQTRFPHKHPFIDALSMAYSTSGEWGMRVPNWKLKSWCERFGIEQEGRHRALPGAMKAMQVLRAVACLEDEMDL